MPVCVGERRHSALLHDDAAARTGRNDGLAEDLVLTATLVHLEDQRARTAQGHNLVQNAIRQFSLWHLRHVDRGGRREERRGVAIGIDASALSRHVIYDYRIRT